MLVSYMRQYAHPASAGFEVVRVKLGLPLITDSTTVRLVTQEETCQNARDAYVANAPVLGPGAIAPTGRVYVVSIGNVYAVLDPVYRGSSTDFPTIQILDSKYKLMKYFF